MGVGGKVFAVSLTRLVDAGAKKDKECENNSFFEEEKFIFDILRLKDVWRSLVSITKYFMDE